ncbi:hypothetical protein [Hyalangium versicolor]|uniref:hypothetical protein n=1 Tax=Hyalangium versicolor TaxID=2861190 RepID=UPI001CCF4CF2|nr:hypothetical protein [Hyalangium versicolor]
MNPRRSLFCLLALALGGCERFPEDPIFAYGEVRQADGSPHPGLSLTLERTVTPLNAKPGDPPPAFQPYSEVTTDAEGRFILEVLQGDTELLDRDMNQFTPRFRLALPLEGGRGTWVSFEQVDDVELPTLHPWDWHLARVEQPRGPALSFSAPPPAPEQPPSASVLWLLHEDGTSEPLLPSEPKAVVQLLSGNQLLWQQQGVDSPWAPAPWLLEDFTSVEAQVRAHTLGNWGFSPLGANSGGVEFWMEWRSERIPWAAGTLRPVSRGAPGLPLGPEPCPWTDGDLTPVILPDHLGSYPNEVGVDLQALKHLSRVVIRGLEVSRDFDKPEENVLVVEGSEDGEQWMRMAELKPFHPEPLSSISSRYDTWPQDTPFDVPLRTQQNLLFLDVPLVDAPPVRMVRVFVQQTRGNHAILLELAELSLFE